MSLKRTQERKNISLVNTRHVVNIDYSESYGIDKDGIRIQLSCHYSQYILFMGYGYEKHIHTF